MLHPGALLMLALTCVWASSCGGQATGSEKTGGSAPSAATVRLLTAVELDQTVLTLKDLGREFSVLKPLTHTPGGADDSRNCANAMENFGFGVAPADLSKVTYVTLSTTGFKPTVTSYVGTYRSENQAKVEVQNWKRPFDSCHRVDTAVEDYQLDLTVAERDVSPAKGTDQRVEINAEGTIRGEGLEIPYLLRCVVVRVSNQVIVITLRTSSGDADDLTASLVGRATERLSATIARKPLPASVPLDLNFDTVE